MAHFVSTANVGNLQCLGFETDAHVACGTGAFPTTDDIAQVPANGATVSNVFARVNTAPTAGQSYKVDVVESDPAGISPVTPTVIKTCTIAVATTTCTDVSSTTVAAGHYLQVQITNQGGAPNKAFRVSFRW
ncbi:MAG TPA: hypothetical protein VGR46_12045 [Candidatus Limnocylindria bacterium]|nr:hypothetical protein [Candidatus Limnocylindria bacterium]